MKTMKKLFALLLAVLMVMGMATTAMAENVTITIKNKSEGHVYEAYQVFSGTLSNTGVLSDVKWGSGVNGDALLSALKSDNNFLKEGVNQFAACVDAEDVANIISKWSADETPIENFADVVAANLKTDTGSYTTSVAGDGEYVITLPAVGYYFIKDAQAVTGNNVISDYMLYVAKSLEIAPKDSVHTFTKKVNNTLDGTYADAMDAQIGDTVYFKLETKLPSRYNDYKQYVMVMKDVLPAGLDFGEVKDIYVAHANGGHTSYKTGYTNLSEPGSTHVHNVNADGYCSNVASKAYCFNESNSTLTVNFGDLKITQTNPNLNDTITVKYSATLDSDAVYGLAGGLGNENTATVYFSNNMNQSKAEITADQTKWEYGYIEDTANVYTYQLEVTKRDSLTEAPLKGAQFHLYRNYSDEGGNITKKYAYVDGSGVITKWDTTAPTTPLTSDDDGKFIVKGLDSLIYHLEEVKAPEGYNKMENAVQVTVTGTITDHELKTLAGSADSSIGVGTVNDGKLAVTVGNNPGTLLPTTGGIGTTIFYIVGGVLVLGAGAAFVMKRRNEA